VPVAAPARRGVKLRQLEPSVAVRGLHHCYLRPDALEPHHAVHPTALDGPLALQPDSKLDEERRRGREVVDTMPTCSMRWIVMRFSLCQAAAGMGTAVVADVGVLRVTLRARPDAASLGCRSVGENAPPIGLEDQQ
jgi:hypothetical protein